MGAGNLFVRCARCANRCRVRLAVDADGLVTEARKQVPGHRMASYEKCPNLEGDVGLSFDMIRAGGFVEA